MILEIYKQSDPNDFEGRETPHPLAVFRDPGCGIPMWLLEAKSVHHLLEMLRGMKVIIGTSVLAWPYTEGCIEVLV